MARFATQSNEYLQQIDIEIERLQQLREQVSAILEAESQVATNSKRGVALERSRRRITDAGRRAIAEAQRKRWAAKKVAAKKTARDAAGKRKPSKTAAASKRGGRKVAE